MVTPTSFLRKSGPVITGPTGPAPTPMCWGKWLHLYCGYFVGSASTFCNVNSGCLRSHALCVVIYDATYNSVSDRLSVSVPNSHVLALVFKSVTYWSMVSPICWFCVLKTCLSLLQYASNFVMIVFTFHLLCGPTWMCYKFPTLPPGHVEQGCRLNFFVFLAEAASWRK